ncbi:MAG TPA: M15 family metallopeptidase [Actinomycetota bacterium]|nr:M15 family metallopeptidase [Actinomycetota bacterium]
MDALTRQALVRALVAFLAVLVLGSAGLFAIDTLRSSGPTQAEASPSPSPSPGVALPETWLVWVPSGLPEGFGEQLTVVSAVGDVTVATADIAWMSSSTDDVGVPVDADADPYLIPIDVTGVEPAFTSFLPKPERTLVADLGPAQGILSESAAKLRGLGSGATMTFGDEDVEVTGTLPDELMGGYELLLMRPSAERIGVTRERYALFHVREGLAPDPERLAALFLPYVPPDFPYGNVEVRAPGQARYLRANDRGLPPVLLKQRFGEFRAIPDLQDPGPLQVDPAWVSERIASVDLPVIGAVTCHEQAIRALRRAMNALSTAAVTAIESVGDCYEAVADPDDPNGPLTARAFGAAIDLNPATNDEGDPPDQPRKLINAMAKAGFGWGGVDAFPQGALFRWNRAAAPAG